MRPTEESREDPPSSEGAILRVQGAHGAAEAVPGGELEARASGGMKWNIIGFGAGQVIRFASNLVVTRLVVDEQQWGLMAIVFATLTGIGMFSDIGIGPTIVMSKRGGERVFLETAWTIQVLRGLVLMIAATLIAFPMAWIYDAPRLSALIPAAGLALAVGGCNSIQLYVQNRDLRYRAVTLIELGTQVVATVVMITWALIDPTAVALVAGFAAAVAVKAVASWVVLPGPHGRFAWDREAARQILGVGKWFLVSTGLAFLSTQVDRFVIGAMGLGMLGVYHIAVQVAGMPAAALGQFGNVFFPYLARKAHDPAELKAAYASVRRPLLVVGGLVISGLVATGPSLVTVLYPDNFHRAGVILQILAVGLWFGNVLENCNGAAMLAKGLPRWTATGSTAKLVAMAVFMPLGAHLGGLLSDAPDAALHGALIGMVLADFVRYLVTLVAACTHGLGRPLQDLPASGLAVAAIGLAFFVGYAVDDEWIRASLAGFELTPKWSTRFCAAIEAMLQGGVVLLVYLPRLLQLVRAGGPFALPKGAA